MRAVWCLAMKDLKLLVRDRAGFFFAFFFPLIYATFFGTILSGGGRGGSSAMRVAFVDEDGTEQSRSFIASLEKSPSVQPDVTDLNRAVELVRTGKRAALVVITPGFGAARERPFWGLPPTLRMGTDPARQAEAGMLQGLLTQEMAKGLQDFFTDPKRMSRQLDEALAQMRADPNADPLTVGAFQLFGSSLRGFLNRVTPEMDAEGRSDGNDPEGYRGFQPVRFEQQDVIVQRIGPQSYYVVSFPQGIIWGVMGCAAGFGISLVSERSGGTLVRLRMAPIGTTQILAGKAVACLLAVIGVTVVLLAVAAVAFHVQPASYALLAAAVACVALAFVGVMMLLAVIGKTERAAGGIGWAILTIMGMLGGGMLPLFLMPQWLQTLSAISPVKWAILALEGALWRGFTAREMLLPCGVLLVVGAVCFTIGVRTFSWTQRA